MRELKRQQSTSSFVPDFMATSLVDVDFKVLKDRGVRYVAIDADSTLVRYRSTKIAPKVKAYLDKQKQFIDDWCIASNRVTNNLDIISKALNAPVVPTGILARKPRQRYFRRITNHFQADPGQIAMIGDKLLADVWGGNRAGMVTVWVEHLGDDGLHDRMIRVRDWEQRIIKRRLSQIDEQ